MNPLARTYPQRAPAPAAPGQAMVEFALVSLLLIAVLILIFEGGLLTANWFALGNAAREGARAGSIATATDDLILDAVNRTATPFTGGYTGVTANTPQSACTTQHALCVCRHKAGQTACITTVGRGDQIDVTVRHRFVFLPFAGGFIGQTAGLQLTGYERALIE